jgi:phosphoenolpyruvate synthase/pyruvate phosphate dikinase
MIELPRACLKADEIAEAAEFFSFGTNDLTQTTFGIGREDRPEDGAEEKANLSREIPVPIFRNFGEE